MNNIRGADVSMVRTRERQTPEPPSTLPHSYVCTCLQGRRPERCHRRRPCSGRRRSQPCCRCTSGTPPSPGRSYPQRSGRCCHCTCRLGRPGLARSGPVGHQRNRRRRAHSASLQRSIASACITQGNRASLMELPD